MLFEVLGLPTDWIRSLGNEKGSKKFLRICGKLHDMNIKNLSKKTLEVEF